MARSSSTVFPLAFFALALLRSSTHGFATPPNDLLWFLVLTVWSILCVLDSTTVGQIFRKHQVLRPSRFEIQIQVDVKFNAYFLPLANPPPLIPKAPPHPRSDGDFSSRTQILANSEEFLRDFLLNPLPKNVAFTWHCCHQLWHLGVSGDRVER